ncbi:MAG TPA: hypothetical protein VGO93_09545, partial [Candidatus Xenobia bacterium]
NIYDAQHKLTSQMSTWKDNKGQLNSQILSHHGNNTEFRHSVHHQDGSCDTSTHARDGHHVTSDDLNVRADGSENSHHHETWEGGMFDLQEHDDAHMQLIDQRGTSVASGSTIKRECHRLDGNTMNVRQRTFGPDGALRQEYQSTQDGSQRFAGHHFHYTPQGVDRQYWWQGVGRQEQSTPATATHRLQQIMSSGPSPSFLNFTA